MSNEFEKNLLFLMVGGDLAEFSGCPFVRTQHSFCHPCRHVQEEMQSSFCGQEPPSLVGSFRLLITEALLLIYPCEAAHNFCLAPHRDLRVSGAS